MTGIDWQWGYNQTLEMSRMRVSGKMNKVPGQQESVEDYYNTLNVDDEFKSTLPRKQTIDSPATAVKNPRKKKHFWCWFCLAAVIVLLLFTPFRINILLLGIDPTLDGSATGRSDTMILTTIPPISPYMHMLSIPRDLWVNIPGHGQNRINTAHFFAEIAKPGSGPQAAAEAVELNFNVPVQYTVRIKVDGFKKIVNAMGGVTVDLPTDMSGYTAGKHFLNGRQALALVRDRKGSDDFYRQERGQIFLKGAMKQMINPINWWRIPKVATAIAQSITTNIPFYLWPRVGYSVLFSGITGFDTHSLDHKMVQGWITDGGADVLLPNWELINPLVDKLFR
jgi:polyisoprenyl-teichoic acid--peptidoglycan teichoic acid transferase